MSSKTINYELTKPDQTDFYGINVHNNNMDIIDEKLFESIKKVNSPKTGNFPVLNEDGSVKDSGKCPNDFLDSTFEKKSVSSEPGVHGLRYKDKKFEVFDGNEWETVDGGVGIYVNIVAPSGSLVTVSDGNITRTGVSENDSLKLLLPNYGVWTFFATLNGQTSNTVKLECNVSQLYNVTLTYFSATIDVVAKIGSTVTIKKGDTFQSVESDGTASFTVKEAGEYSVYATYDGVNSNETTVNVTTSGEIYSTSVSFILLTIVVDSGSTIKVLKDNYSYTQISSGSNVFYLPAIGTWSIEATLNGETVTDTINITSYTEYSKTLVYYKIYGVNIDLSNSNPDSAVTYTDDAIGVTAGSIAWDSRPIFKDIKPCMLKNGVVQYYLNPSNFAQKETGESADITSGSDGDVMIEIPKIGYKITTSGNILSIKITDNPNASGDGFKYYAHTRGTEGDREKLYVGAYLGNTINSKLRSLSNKSPTVNQTIGTFRTQAKANGDGYDLISFYPLILLQCLFLIRYKNLNSQTALGRGYVDASAKTNTGTTNSNGMYYGTTSGKVHVKFAGIEDFWGNLLYWIDGLYSDSNRNILTAFSNFNDTGSNYTNRGKGSSSNVSGYMSKPQGTSEMGFIIQETNGSSSTYFADYGYLYASSLPIFGGSWGNGDYAGAFRLSVYSSASDSDSYLGGRLMYL